MTTALTKTNFRPLKLPAKPETLPARPPKKMPSTALLALMAGLGCIGLGWLITETDPAHQEPVARLLTPAAPVPAPQKRVVEPPPLRTALPRPVAVAPRKMAVRSIPWRYRLNLVKHRRHAQPMICTCALRAADSAPPVTDAEEDQQ